MDTVTRPSSTVTTHRLPDSIPSQAASEARQGEVSHRVLRETRLPAIPSSTRAIPSLARGTTVPIPSTLSQNSVFCLAAGPEAVLVAPGHKDDRCHALLRDGSDVGIRPISGQQSSVLTYEKRLPVDTRVGVRGAGLRGLSGTVGNSAGKPFRGLASR
jgi:hypothetical protein